MQFLQEVGERDPLFIVDDEPLRGFAAARVAVDITRKLAVDVEHLIVDRDGLHSIAVSVN